MIAYKFELYHHNKKNRKLHEMCNSCGSLWNYIVKFDKKYYRTYHKSANKAQLQKLLTKNYIKQNQYWKIIPAQTKQEVVFRYLNAREKWFKKKGKLPKTKDFRNFNSFVFQSHQGYKIIDNHLHINCLNTNFTFWKSRNIEGVIKQIRIKRTSAGGWYLYVITTKSLENTLSKRCNANPEGFDFGMKIYLTASNGKEYKAPEYFKKSLKQLRKAQRALSKNKMGSNHRKQAKIRVAKLHETVANRRSDFHWKLAHELCKSYSVICLEDLNMKAMQRLWGRKVSDLGFSEFVQKLEYVATKYGTEIVKVDRFFPSTKQCSNCGYKNNALTLKDREWTCPHCGAYHHRDVNAARNVLREGILVWDSNSKTKTDISQEGSCVDTINQLI
jgi:putative transposase